MFCSPLPYQANRTVYSGGDMARSVAASTYGRNAYVWTQKEKRTLSESTTIKEGNVHHTECPVMNVT